MNIKDTVMSDIQIGEIYGNTNVCNFTERTWEMPRKIAQAQAEYTARKIIEEIEKMMYKDGHDYFLDKPMKIIKPISGKQWRQFKKDLGV